MSISDFPDPPKRRKEREVIRGTLIRFKPSHKQIELARTGGIIIASHPYGFSYLYDVDVGPGWGFLSAVTRSEFTIA